MLPTILIVDDEPMLLDLFQEALADEYDVLTAESIGKAVDLLQNQPVNMVVTDLNCGQGNGLDLLRWIQDNRPKLLPSCLLMSGDPMADTDGVNVPVICKPIDLEELSSTCKSMLHVA